MAKTYLRTGRIAWSPLTASQKTMLANVAGIAIGSTFSATLDSPTETFLVGNGVISVPSSAVVASSGDTVGNVPVDNGDGTYSWGASGGGGSHINVVRKTSDYTAASGDVVLADASGGDFTVTLPAPTASATVVVKKVDGGGGTVNVTAQVANTIDVGSGGLAQSTVPLSDFMVAALVSTADGWYITTEPGPVIFQGGYQLLCAAGGTFYLSDAVAANNSGNGVLWVANTDGSQFFSVSLGSSGQFKWLFQADGGLKNASQAGANYYAANGAGLPTGVRASSWGFTDDGHIYWTANGTAWNLKV